MSNLQRLYLMCGLAFVGKSTLAAAVAARTAALVVSLDAINAERGLAGGLGIPDEEWARSHAIALARVEEGLAAGRTVVLDDTSCFRFLRDGYRAVADRCGVPSVVLHLDAPLALVRQRRRENDAAGQRPVVTDRVLRELADKFEPPAPDENALVVPAGANPAAWVAANIPAAAPRGRG